MTQNTTDPKHTVDARRSANRPYSLGEIEMTDTVCSRNMTKNAALKDAIGLCESEAARWRGEKTGDHWQAVADVLKAEFFPAAIVDAAKNAVKPIIDRERDAEHVGQGIMDARLRQNRPSP